MTLGPTIAALLPDSITIDVDVDVSVEIDDEEIDVIAEAVDAHVKHLFEQQRDDQTSVSDGISGFNG